jgi:hypothetical protein
VVLADKAFLIEVKDAEEAEKNKHVRFLLPESMKSELRHRTERITRPVTYGMIEPDRVVIENIIGRIQGFRSMKGLIPNNGLRQLPEMVDVVCGNIFWKIRKGEQRPCRDDDVVDDENE